MTTNICPLCKQEIVYHPTINRESRCNVCDREVALKEERRFEENKEKSPDDF